MIGLLRRVRFFVFEERDLLIFEGRGLRGECNALPAGMEWIWVSSAQNFVGKALIDATGLGRKFMKRWASGERCLVAKAGDSLAHFTWLSVSAVFLPEIGFVRALPVGTEYLYHSHTFVPFRGKGIYTAVLTAARTWAGQQGLKRLLVATQKDNSPAQRAMIRAGYSQISQVRARRRCGSWRYEPADWFPA